MSFQWISMLPCMLATESRMVVHVTVGAVDSWIPYQPCDQAWGYGESTECRLAAALEIAALPSQLDMEWLHHQDRGSLAWHSISPRSRHGRPCSSGFVRLDGSTGTDWPRLEDPLVEVVDHLEELPSSHVHESLEVLTPLLDFFCQS